MKQTLISLLLGFACIGSASALDLGKLLTTDNINKALDVAKNANEASREWTPEQEAALGDEIAARMLGAKPLVKNAALQRYVNQVGEWVASQSDKPDFKWRFAVIEDETVNSFAMPGGVIFITKGLWDRLKNESELAAVLGHEITHVTRHHHLDAMRAEAKKNAVSSLTDLAVSTQSGKKNENLAKMGNNAFKGLGMEGLYTRGLDKDLEYEADVTGMVLLARAGYNPYAMVTVLQMLEGFNRNPGGLPLFNTHADPRARQDVIEASIGDKLDSYAGNVEQTSRFLAIKGKPQQNGQAKPAKKSSK
ncbi:M48 family metalloprotease [Chitinilyticum piscinae]|uniref:M48 family metalloprotease n=1 Tax=Chitinilyticum piscinae TaxID=2866724 RepID=A0A8J7FP59_9NEIS|nr:M48 family metalloprotease [Chitinilyticum piscinae]MBE9611010.1 M48 family metalloprotease [Chitinilyticum piscinae]